MKVQNHNNLSIDKKKILFVRLGWWILEQKLLYYYPNQYGACVDDTIYDHNEDAYKELAEELNLNATACNNVGFPSDSPSGRLIISKFEKGNAKLTDLTITASRSSKSIPEPTKRIRTRTRPNMNNVDNSVESVNKTTRKRIRQRPDSGRVRIRPRKRSS
ncbi:MAG: hypothetical protein HRU18_01710 [Pseudoalteromonas sp.]|uniref:hypothetical protein n=1 Tax=Pseudoalteromonas sp. TaxID=53249 RepID=UPI001D44DBBD|nr:hypothetical protein [Pseudoalteromonas sp.]NRA76898.1 hypothetical protein [Pseudoalteromonas sp.]